MLECCCRIQDQIDMKSKFLVKDVLKLALQRYSRLISEMHCSRQKGFRRAYQSRVIEVDIMPDQQHDGTRSGKSVKSTQNTRRLARR